MIGFPLQSTEPPEVFLDYFQEGGGKMGAGLGKIPSHTILWPSKDLSFQRGLRSSQCISCGSFVLPALVWRRGLTFPSLIPKRSLAIRSWASNTWSRSTFCKGSDGDIRWQSKRKTVRPSLETGFTHEDYSGQTEPSPIWIQTYLRPKATVRSSVTGSRVGHPHCCLSEGLSSRSQAPGIPGTAGKRTCDVSKV